MALPQKLSLDMMANTWASALDPIINNPANNSIILKNVSLVIGNNVINHRLGRNLQGWSIVRKRAAASIYDAQDSNPIPNLTLILVSDADVVIDLEVL